MANSKRKCKHCKEYTLAKDGVIVPAGFFCSFDHATQFAQSRAKPIAERMAKRELAERKKALKPLKWFESQAQAAVNEYVRLRDRLDGCISCHMPADYKGQWHASHLYSRGESSALRFNLWNIHKSCAQCNSHKSGNISEYKPRAIAKIGEERHEWLVRHKKEPTRYSQEYLIRLARVFRKRVRLMKKRHGLD